MKIHITQLCEKRTVSRDDGEKLNKVLREKWDEENIFDIDFENILVASVSFIDEAFGKLALQHTKEDLKRKLRFKNILKYDLALLNDIINSRLRQKETVEETEKVEKNTKSN
ncbi:MAG: STAS-like domain-containing protein [bacterium]